MLRDKDPDRVVVSEDPDRVVVSEDAEVDSVADRLMP